MADWVGAGTSYPIGEGWVYPEHLWFERVFISSPVLMAFAFGSPVSLVENLSSAVTVKTPLSSAPAGSVTVSSPLGLEKE